MRDIDFRGNCSARSIASLKIASSHWPSPPPDPISQLRTMFGIEVLHAQHDRVLPAGLLTDQHLHLFGRVPGGRLIHDCPGSARCSLPRTPERSAHRTWRLDPGDNGGRAGSACRSNVRRCEREQSRSFTAKAGSPVCRLQHRARLADKLDAHDDHPDPEGGVRQKPEP
jgi:hypothetical protein